MTEAPAGSIARTVPTHNTQALRSPREKNRLARRTPVPAVIALFIVSILVPVYFFIGPIRLSPYRVILLVLFVPCVAAWLSGGCGKIRMPDILILLSALWAAVGLLVNHGLDLALEPAGIFLVETFGSYLLARRFVRNVSSFEAMVKTLFFAIACLLPFAAFESVTGHSVILETLGKVVPTFEKGVIEARYGLERAQVVFEHPILYGTFCASAFGLAYYVLGKPKNQSRRLLRAGVIVLATMFSVSSGAVVSIIMQSLLMSWDYMTRKLANRWLILGFACVGAYVAIDVLSNRSPFHVFVTYLTLDLNTGYGRILIWDYGTAEVARHPVFGIGLNDWVRAPWMSSSMDNFWLLIAVSHGLPTFIFLTGGILLIMKGLGRRKLENERLKACRQGFLISLGGLVIAGCTVHYYNAIYCWFMFLIGSGVWMLDEGSGKTSEGTKRKSSRPSNFSRFNVKKEPIDRF